MASTRKTIRSVRTSDEAWTGARERAQREGVSMSHVVNEFVEGYAAGALDLPEVITQKVYPDKTE